MEAFETISASQRSNFQARYRKHRQMQLIERVEHTGQGSLIAQLTFQGCDRGPASLWPGDQSYLPEDQTSLGRSGLAH